MPVSRFSKKCSYTVSIEDAPSAGAHLPDEDTLDTDRKSPEELLSEALAVLPPKCKEIFLLSKLKGMKYKEIAELLSLSEKTVENQMGKAIKLLREFAATCSFTIAVIITLIISIISNNI